MEVDVGFDWAMFSPSPTIGDKIHSFHSGGSTVSFCDGHQQCCPLMWMSTLCSSDDTLDKGCPPNNQNGSLHYSNLDTNAGIPIPLQDVLDEAKVR